MTQAPALLLPLLLSLLLCLGAATVGGVFFAFSSFVMKALAELPSARGIAAMQRINAVVLNPVFLGVFMGTALLSVACLVAAWYYWNAWSAMRSWLLAAAGFLYAAGSFGVTAACNVPRNEKLAVLDGESAEAAAYWPRYVEEWLRWNHVRTAASLASAACAALAMSW